MAVKWSREHEVIRQRILERQQLEAPPFEDLSEEAVATRKALPLVDLHGTTDWCRTYLPHYFDRPFARFHGRMAGAVGEGAMPTFVAAFRGAGKSVLLALARPLREILSRRLPFAIYGARVQKLAAQNMDYVRLEIEHNPRIRCDYGELTVEGEENEWIVSLPKVRDEGGKWALRGAKVEAFGIGMSPRGRRFGEWRPAEFIGDDLEDSELARNPEREKNLWDWMMDEVLPALEPERYRFTVLGTMFGPLCMMERAKELAAKRDAQGRALGRLFLQQAVENGHSVWPERFSDAALERTRAQIGLRNWNRNFALISEDPDKPFQAAWFTDYEADALDVSQLDVVAFLDPAISQSAMGCPRALITVGADRDSGRRYVLEAWVTRGTPMQMVDQIFEVNTRWQPRVIGIEINGGYALIRPLLEMRGGDAFLPIRYVTHVRPKELRIERLAPQFEAKRWFFPRSPGPGIRALQEQLLSYPDGFVDGPDALAGCDEMLPDALRPRKRGTEYRSLGRRREGMRVLV